MKKLSVKQSLFAEAILSGVTIAEAAATAGVKQSAAFAWLRKGLRQHIDDLRKSAFEAGLQKLERSLSAAVDTLAEMTTSSETPPPQKLGAAKTILEQAVKIYELRDIEGRLAALEQAAKATG